MVNQMSKFWPHRPSPEGFSIEKLAKTYRDRLAKTSYETSPSLRREASKLTRIKVDNEGHWANRDFEEYRKVA